MRLIDVDKLIEALDDKILWTNEGWVDVTSVIDEQPTAYDLEKVVEELSKEKTKKNDTLALADIEINGIIDKAIDIVRRGGTDEIN